MDMQASQPLTQCLVKATLAAGTTTTLSTTSTTSGYVVYAIRGKAYKAADLSNTATPTTDYATGKAFLPVLANQGSIFMVGFDHAGALKAVQGTVTALDTNGAFITAPIFGGLPTDFCPIGYIVIKAGSTADATTGWIFGTSNMSSVTGITYTFVDIIGEPDRPQIS